MKFQILDQLVVSYSFNLKNDNELSKTEPQEGKIIVSLSIPDKIVEKEPLSLVTEIELRSPTYDLELKLVFRIENEKFSYNYIKEKEKEIIAILYPYAISSIKNLLISSDIPSNSLPYFPVEL